MVSTTQRERSDRCGVHDPTHKTASERLIVTCLSTPQHDLKGRTPERSEWLVAEGAAKRNPRYRATNHDAKYSNITCFGGRFRVLQTLFLGDDGFPGVALRLTLG